MDDSSNPLYSTVIFIVLNLLFIVLLFTGLAKFSSGAATYEEVYSKKIALFLDYASPGMELKINFEKGFEICRETHCSEENMVKIKEGAASVFLSSGGGYSYYFFKDYKYEVGFEKEFLIIKVGEKENV